MKKSIKICCITISCIIVILILAIVFWYVRYIPPFDSFNHNKYFDLSVADEFFNDAKNQTYNHRTNDIIQVKWNIPVEQFWNNDTINISFTNTTNKKLYYLGFKSPYYYIVLDYVITLKGKSDTLYFEEWGDFEALDEAEYIPFKKNESIILKGYNPLLQYPTFDFLPMDTEEFPKIIKEVYGDTVQIRYGAYLRRLSWNNRGFSITYSDFIKISTNSIIDGWQNGKFANHRHYNPEVHQEYLNERDEIMKRYKQK